MIDSIVRVFNDTNKTYNVNLLVMELFYIASVPFYYYGYYLMGRSGYRYFKGKNIENKRFDFGDLLKEKGFVGGLIINRFGWVLPYIYLIIVGKNIPVWVYFLIIIWLMVTTYLAFWRTRTDVLRKAVTYKMAGKDDEVEARKFLSKRYGEVGFISETESKLPYIDQYVKYSRYFIAKNIDEIAGVIRVVNNSKMGLPVLNDSIIYKNEMAKLKKVGIDNVAEIGNLAAISGQKIANGLYKIVIKHCLDNRLVTVARIDSGLLSNLFKKYPILRFFVRRIGDDVEYPGSICVPVKIKFNLFMLLFI